MVDGNLSQLDGTNDDSEVLDASASAYINQREQSDPFVSIIQISTEGKGTEMDNDDNIVSGVEASKIKKVGRNVREKSKPFRWLVQLAKSPPTRTQRQEMHQRNKFKHYEMDLKEQGLNHRELPTSGDCSTSNIKDKRHLSRKNQSDHKAKHRAAHTCIVTVTTTNAEMERNQAIANAPKAANIERSSSFTCATVTATDSSLSSADNGPTATSTRPTGEFFEPKKDGVRAGLEPMQQQLQNEWKGGKGIKKDGNIDHSCGRHVISQALRDSSTQPFLHCMLTGNCEDISRGSGDVHGYGGNAYYSCNKPFHEDKYDNASIIASPPDDPTADSDSYSLVEDRYASSPPNGFTTDAVEDGQDDILVGHYMPFMEMIADMATSTFSTSNVNTNEHHQNHYQEKSKVCVPFATQNGLEEGNTRQRVQHLKVHLEDANANLNRKDCNNEENFLSSNVYSISNPRSGCTDERSASTSRNMWDILLQKDLQYCTPQDEVYQNENEEAKDRSDSSVSSNGSDNKQNECRGSIKTMTIMPGAAIVSSNETVLSADCDTVGSLSLTPFPEATHLLGITKRTQDVGSLVRDMSAREVVLDKKSRLDRLQHQRTDSRPNGSATSTQVLYSKLDRENSGSPDRRTRGSPMRVLGNALRRKLPVAAKNIRQFNGRPSKSDDKIENEKPDHLNMLRETHVGDAKEKFPSIEEFGTKGLKVVEYGSNDAPLLCSSDVTNDTVHNENKVDGEIKQGEKRPNFSARNIESEEVKKIESKKLVAKEEDIGSGTYDLGFHETSDTCSNAGTNVESSCLGGKLLEFHSSGSFRETNRWQCNELVCRDAKGEGMNASVKPKSHKTKEDKQEEQFHGGKYLKHHVAKGNRRPHGRRRRCQFEYPDYRPKLPNKHVSSNNPPRPASQIDWIY